jgi:hypothetical protein
VGSFYKVAFAFVRMFMQLVFFPSLPFHFWIMVSDDKKGQAELRGSQPPRFGKH